MYLFTGLLLIGWVQSVRARQQWDREGRIYDGHLGILTMSDTALVAIVALFIAFLLPAAGQWGPANAVYSVRALPWFPGKRISTACSPGCPPASVAISHLG